LVRHHDEQLSMAISFESESNAVVLPIDAAAIHVMATNRMLFADFLLQ
jgi:hypothetical protein